MLPSKSTLLALISSSLSLALGCAGSGGDAPEEGNERTVENATITPEGDGYRVEGDCLEGPCSIVAADVDIVTEAKATPVATHSATSARALQKISFEGSTCTCGAYTDARGASVWYCYCTPAK